MANKLVQQQLKNILRGLNDHDLEKLLSNYEILSHVHIEKTCRMVSYKCYEATMSLKTWTSNGYGRTEVEASNNCIKNFLEMIMEDETGLSSLIKALKKSNEPLAQTRPTRDNNEKIPNANNTLALNGSYTQVQENNSSFDTRKDLEILSKNIGNISVIGNMRHNSENHNSSQLEMDDMLLKMMMDDGTHIGAGLNNFRKSLPPQHPNGLDLGGNNHAGGTKSYTNMYKADRGERASSLTRNSVGSEESEAAKNKKVLQENTSLYNNNKGSNLHSNDKEENRYDSRQDNKIPPSQFKYKTSGSYKELEQKQHQHQLSQTGLHNPRPGTVEPSSHKEARRESREHERGSTKCLCSCSEQLQRANLRIESLEKKLKLLNEENKILKYMTTEVKDKEIKSDLSSMTSTNAPPTKSTYDKSIGNYDLTPHENCDDLNEFPDKEANGQTDNKSRSLSLDAYARRKTFMEPHYNQKSPSHYNKENNESMEKKDVKKMIPRLKLEMIPNYHAKYNQNSNAAGTQNPSILGATKGYTQQAVQNPSSNYMYSQNSFESGLGTGSTNLSKYIKK